MASFIWIVIFLRTVTNKGTITHPIKQVLVAQEMVKLLQVSPATSWKSFDLSPTQNQFESFMLLTIPSRIKALHFSFSEKIYPQTWLWQGSFFWEGHGLHDFHEVSAEPLLNIKELHKLAVFISNHTISIWFNRILFLLHKIKVWLRNSLGDTVQMQ